MTIRYQQLAFTDAVKKAQEAQGSRRSYARFEGLAGEAADDLSEDEIAFISSRDSFYMATVSETGWPYLQHRGGQPGFIKVLSPRLLGIADFRGNRQYISLGNVTHDDRSALFFMDYPRQARLKMMARVEAVSLDERPELTPHLVDADYGAKIERGLLFHVEAFDWNCPQHITPRYTRAELEPALANLQNRITELERENQRLSARVSMEPADAR